MGVDVLRPEGHLDAVAVTRLVKAGMDLAQQGHCLVDLAFVSSIESAGLGALLGLQRQLQAQGREVAVCAPTSNVLVVLELMRFHQLMTIFPSEQLATDWLIGARS